MGESEGVGREGQWLEGRVLQLQWGLRGPLQMAVAARPMSGVEDFCAAIQYALSIAINLTKGAVSRGTGAVSCRKRPVARGFIAKYIDSCL